MAKNLQEYKDESDNAALEGLLKKSSGGDEAVAGSKKLLPGSLDLLGAGELLPASNALDDDVHNERGDVNDIYSQASVQRMPADVKESQELLQKKISKILHDEFADFLLKEQTKDSVADADVIMHDSDSDEMLNVTKAQVLKAFKHVTSVAPAMVAALIGKPEHDNDIFQNAGFKHYDSLVKQAEKCILKDFLGDVAADEAISEDHITDLMDDENSSSEPNILARDSSASIKTVYSMQKISTPPAQDDVVAGKAEKIPNDAFVYKYGFDTLFKPKRLHPFVESLIYWRAMKKSGAVFGAVLIILFALSCCSVISVFARLSLLALIATAGWRIYKTIVMKVITKSNEGHPFKQYLDLDLTLSQEKVKNYAEIAVAPINGFITELRRLFLVQNMLDSFKFGIILWMLTFIGAWFNGMTLIILTFVALFTLPKIYESNGTSIDAYLHIVQGKLTEINDQIMAAVTFGFGAKQPIVEETDKNK